MHFALGIRTEAGVRNKMRAAGMRFHDRIRQEEHEEEVSGTLLSLKFLLSKNAFRLGHAPPFCYLPLG